MSRFSQFNVVLVALIAGFAADASASHPYHVTRAEVEYNKQRQTFQVALCVWPEDMEKAVSVLAERAVDIDAEPAKQLNALMKAYVAKKFTFVPVAEEDGDDVDVKADAQEAETSKAASIRWVGSEVKIKQAWLYFEVDASAGSNSDWQIENQMFLELNDDQLNQLQIRSGKSWFSKTLSAQDASAVWSR